ncbi:MAG: Fe-S cluster assembly protein SufD [Planctomycetota bacterium]|jgi:Fe-S cluster assembly protein SufD|nr:MAG: Fe-S cluster assembly protein SufD [Planctomycetota bacterium]
MLTAISSRTVAYDAETFESFLATRQEPAWVTDQRRQAFEVYRELLATELDPEEWKRVDTRAFRPEKFAIGTASQSAASFGTLLADRAEFGGIVSHVDGVCSVSKLDPDLASQGVLFGNLSDLLRDHGEILRPHLLTRGVKSDTDRFSAWHAAFWTGGTVLYVPRNVEIAKPLYSLIGLAAEGAADFSHTLVILEEGAQATLLEETSSASATASGMHIGAVELLQGSRSNLQYVQLQNWNNKVWHFAHQAGRVEADASLRWSVAGLGARLAHIHQDVYLDGKGATAQVNGVTFATDKQLISYYTQQTHNAPNTQSDLLYKDVVRDHARCVWRGMIKVAKDAQKTDGYQRNDSLLLSETCRVDAIPGLEIEADDVRCTHGATCGRVDEEQLFYCMCRGLTRSEAMHIIVEGFFQRVYDRIPVEIVRETLGQAVERKLGIGGE